MKNEFGHLSHDQITAMSRFDWFMDIVDCLMSAAITQWAYFNPTVSRPPTPSDSNANPKQ